MRSASAFYNLPPLPSSTLSYFMPEQGKKGPLSHQKMKCSFLDYIQLLMMGQVIWAMKIDQNAKKRPPKSSKNEILVFGLCSTSDDQPSDPSEESQPKCEKGPQSYQKMKCSFLD